MPSTTPTGLYLRHDDHPTLITAHPTQGGCLGRTQCGHEARCRMDAQAYCGIPPAFFERAQPMSHVLSPPTGLYLRQDDHPILITAHPTQGGCIGRTPCSHGARCRIDAQAYCVIPPAFFERPQPVSHAIYHPYWAIPPT